MELGELLRAAGVAARCAATPRSRSAISPTTAAGRRRGRCSSAFPGEKADGHEFAAAGGRGGRGGAGGRARARAGRAAGRGRGRAGGDGAARGALLRRPDRGAAGRRDHRDQRQDDDRLPGPRDPRGGRQAAAGCWGRSSRWSAGSRRRSSGRRRRRSTCSATFRPHARGRRRGLRDGGLLARAGPAPRRRDPLRGRALHQPDPGPPRLPRRHGGLLRAPSGCSSRGGAPTSSSRRTRCQRRRPLRAAPGRGVLGRAGLHHLLGRGRRGRLSARDVALRRQRRALRLPRRRTGEIEVRTPLPGHFNVANALGGARRGRRAGARPASAAARRWRGRRRSRAASSRSTRASSSRSSSTTPTPRTRWRTCCARRGG